MSVTWIFAPLVRSPHVPAIHGQLEHLSKSMLILRNPWIRDSVLDAKFFCAWLLLLMIFFYPTVFSNIASDYDALDTLLFIGMLLAPLTFTPFLAIRIWVIKNVSSLYFNRDTQKIYFQRGRKLRTLDWNLTAGGILGIPARMNGSAFYNYALALAMPRADGSLPKNDCIWIESNQPTESSIIHVAEVWEYIRQFMAHGPDQLPPAREPNWWYVPLDAICLTPAQAWRHYAPWRTGERGEMQGKKCWQLPFWAVLFPYNLSVAVFWYAICRMFNIKAAPAPPEAFETAPESNNEIDIKAALTHRRPRRKKADKQRV